MLLVGTQQGGVPSLLLSVSHHCCHMQRGNFGLTFIIGEDDDSTALWRDGSVVWRGDNVFAAVTRPYGEREERACVKKFSDAGNQAATLLRNRI